MSPPKLDFHGVLEALPDLVLICDEDGLVVWTNAAARSFFGPELADLAEQPADTWLQGEDGLLWSYGGRPKERLLVYSGFGRDERMSGSVRGFPIGGELGWCIVLRLASGPAARLEGVMALAGSIAEQLAAELKTIITSASTALIAAPPEPHAEPLRAILEAAESAARLQKQVAGLGGEQPLARVPLSLGSLVRANARSMGRALGELSLELDLSEGRGLVQGDARALGVALGELCEWIGRKHRSATRVRVSMEEPKGRVRLLIADDGPGMTASERAALHDPANGLGLGLVMGVVSQHGGRVLVDSSLGRGTVFHLDFPELGPEPPQREALAPGTGSVLVIEDDPAINGWVCETLRKRGYSTRSAQNGVEGFARLREHMAELDLLIVDAILPGVSGLELIAEALHAERPPRILLMTGYSADLVDNDLVQKVPLLEKPFSAAELLAQVDGLLGA